MLHQSAVILYQRGIEWENPCEQCETSGTFRKCVVGFEYDSAGTTRAFFQGPCANCLWNGKSAKCGYYLGRTQGWNSDDDVTILQAGGLLRALDSGPALKDIPPKVEEIADDSAERQSKTAVLENDPFRFLLEERNDKAEEHQSTCTTHGSVDVESDSTEECPQVSPVKDIAGKSPTELSDRIVQPAQQAMQYLSKPRQLFQVVGCSKRNGLPHVLLRGTITICPPLSSDSASVAEAMLLRTLLLALLNRARHSYDYRTFMAARLEILALINQRPFATAVSFSAKEHSKTTTTKTLFLADIQRVWEASLILLRARESVVPANWALDAYNGAEFMATMSGNKQQRGMSCPLPLIAPALPPPPLQGESLEADIDYHMDRG
ncbi:hypothetical protein IFM58399_07350 [Aspergillus lentulus]|uniref:Uncharacterized protein n=1 Tax=Aspergillus lentulus TaxID=293939 RepID=A0ABQ1ASL8_ASPLE|nr:uncharacterized protein IFM58399_07350 [Aspergillus lentulus]KAF4170207.1 hypothetical protein CNMCM6936_003395 [Aspergillus lentulus]GFF44664.1 hypothetical protein IFM58399_07350 [Aspergillus lentulus]GFF68931.1 hypothetical protein IFM62136_07440 [Aspergillus lentulus]GFF87353.1 hypothetical protein IFM60648_08016 [Aspergillus lentulus]